MKQIVKITEGATIKSLGGVALLLVVLPYVLVLAVILLQDYINPFDTLVIPVLMIASNLSAAALAIHNIRRKNGSRLIAFITLAFSVIFFIILLGIYVSLIPRSPY